MNFKDTNYAYHTVGGHDIVFEISNQDYTIDQFNYFGYISISGSWVIKRQETVGQTTIYTYIAGRKILDYLVNWDVDGTYIGSLSFKRYDQLIFE